tara:strand:+ start:5863 stop:6123 length:261 start_codon:yes stop_codon:yes gene_type:complete
MADRYDLKTARSGTDGKTYWTKIGVMFPNKSGKDSFNLIFESLPIPSMSDSGQLEVRVMAMEPFKDDGQARPVPASPEKLDDEVPF